MKSGSGQYQALIVQSLSAREMLYLGCWRVLEGPAGSGKYFSLDLALDILQELYPGTNSGFVVRVFAPTRLTAKFASEALCRECIPLSEGLNFTALSAPEYNEENPLNADVVVVCESDRLDTLSSKYLMCAVPDNAKMIFLYENAQSSLFEEKPLIAEPLESKGITLISMTPLIHHCP